MLVWVQGSPFRRPHNTKSLHHDVMVDSPSKKQKPARYKLPSSGNLFLVSVVIYDKIERI